MVTHYIGLLSFSNLNRASDTRLGVIGFMEFALAGLSYCRDETNPFLVEATRCDVILSASLCV